MIHKRTVLMWGALMWGLLTVIVILINYRAASETVKISEVCGHNRTVIYDESIQPGEYLLLWACNPVDAEYLENTSAYLGFSLRDEEVRAVSGESGRQSDR